MAASYVAKAKEKQLRKYETDLKENAFWLRTLSDVYRHGLDPQVVIDQDRMIRGLHSDDIRKAANRFLDTERYVLGLLYPEEGAGGEGS